MKAREVTYLALIAYFQKNISPNEYFDSIKDLSFDIREKKLAKEIVFGVIRRELSLQYFANQLAKKKLKIPIKDRILLFMGLYQFYFLEKIPLYAIANETIKMVKKHGNKKLVAFFNAVLRNLDKKKLTLPIGNTLDDLSIKYSYPKYFVKSLIKEYGLDQTKKLLDVQNHFFEPMFRDRKLCKELLLENIECIHNNKFKIYRCLDPNLISQIKDDNRFYIQNFTPAYLIEKLSSSISSPKKILDLCASPGGKLLAAHDLFPKAKLYANDISEKKIKTLKENINKYQLEVSLSKQDARYFKSEELFDLIILDVPCSNSGVLHKRAEARWRLSHDHTKQLQDMQLAILENVAKLLTKEGQIWYLTCSILREENEEIINKACDKFDLKQIASFKALPDLEGKDGGFGSVLRKM